MRFLSRCYLWLVFFLLYVPILVLIVFSFNGSGSLADFSGFSLEWYGELFRDGEAFLALRNSLILAVAAAALATTIGTFGALGLREMRNRHVRRLILSATNIPLMNPDIVTGVSMMLLFVAVGSLVGSTDALGFGAMLIAHVTFCLPYALLSVLPRFRQLDPSLSEAAQDLGCTPGRAFFAVELPEILPGVASAFLMSFTLSLDDFVISHFVSSPDFQTLPLYVYNQTAHNVKFSMYALSALIVLAILAVLLAVNFAGSFGGRRARAARAKGGV